MQPIDHHHTFIRFGVYDVLKAQITPVTTYKNGKEEKTIPALKMAAAASLAGAAGGLAGNPADIILVRMTSDLNKPPAERFNYPNALVGLYRMVSTEGVTSLFRGLTPNCIRAVLMSASQLATYDIAKDGLLASGLYQEGTWLHFSASFVAGTVATTVCAPAE
jgi:dicarboxylate transporter 10